MNPLKTIAILATATSITQANYKDSLYVDMFAGSSFLASSDIIQRSMTTEADFDPGNMFGARIGYHHNVNWAFELEYIYRRNDLDTVSGGAFATATEGDYASTSVMFNAIYNFDNLKKEFAGIKWQPYAGLGIGVLTEADIDFTISGVETEYEKDFIPAAQLILGSKFAINNNWALFGEIRYTFAGNIDLRSTSDSSEVSIDYGGSSALIGIRYNF